MKKLIFLTSLLTFSLMTTICFASPPVRANQFSAGTTIRSDEVNQDFDDLFGYLTVGVDAIRANGLDTITEIHSNLKSGSDSQLITGTATAGECGQFDSNGDLVGAGAACGSGSGSSVTSAKYNDLVDPDNNGGITFGSYTNTWTTAIGNSNYFIIDGSGTDFVVQGDGDTTVADLTVGGDDITMATNTSGAVLVADGTNFNPVVMGTDATISSAGALTIAANAVALTTDTTGGYAASTTEAGGATSLEADGLDALTEIAQSIKTALNDTSALVVGTAGSNGEIAKWNTDGTLTDSNLIVGTLTDGRYCRYNSAGTLIDCSYTCADITGSADLCDGSDGGGAGSTPRLDQVLAPGTNVGVGFNFGAFTNSWTFSSGTNTWTSAAGDAQFFRINNASSHAFSVRGDGNVGIGATDPEVELTLEHTGVGPDIYVRSMAAEGTPGMFVFGLSETAGGIYSDSNDVNSGDLTDGFHVANQGEGNSVYSIDSAASHLFTSNGLNHVIINSVGNVGIADTDPSALLSVGLGDLFKVDSKGAVKPAVYSGTMNGASGVDFGAFTNTWTTSIGDAAFFNVDGAFVVRGDGNVGIGETDPSATLYIDGTVTLEDFANCTALETSSGVLTCGTDAEGSGGGGGSTKYNDIIDPDNNGGITFTTFANSWTSAASTTDFYTITATDLSSGDAQTIVVDNTMTTGKALNILGGSAGTSPILTVDDVNVGVGTSAPRGALEVLTAGNVGIGNTAPTQKLEVTGNIRKNGEQSDYTANSHINFATFTNSWTFTTGTNTWTSSLDGGTFFQINNSDADNAADTTMMRLNFTDASDANTIFINATDTNSRSVFKVATDGNLTTAGSFTSSGNDMGWKIVDQTDNQACTTGCTSACLFGIENATGTAVTNLVSCDGATADLCACGGGS